MSSRLPVSLRVLPQDVSQYQTASILLRFAMVSFFMLAPTLLQWMVKKVRIRSMHTYTYTPVYVSRIPIRAHAYTPHARKHARSKRH